MQNKKLHEQMKRCHHRHGADSYNIYSGEWVCSQNMQEAPHTSKEKTRPPVGKWARKMSRQLTEESQMSIITKRYSASLITF